MTTRHAVAAASAALLALLSGCASGPPTFAQAREGQDASLATTPFSDDAVVGVVYDNRGVPHYQNPAATMTLDQIGAELLAMRDLDQELVRESTAGVVLDAGEVARIREIDHTQAARLSEIIDAIGWPTSDQVGVEAAQGAFVVIQHAGHEPALQNRALTLMIDQVAQGRLSAPYVALLTDRVRLFADQPQVFGTQMTFETDAQGVARCVPAVAVENPAELDARRELMGLAPHDSFIAQLEEAYQSQHGGAFASVLVGGRD